MRYQYNRHIDRTILTKVVDVTSVSAKTTGFSPNTQEVRIAANTSIHFHFFDNDAPSSTCTSSDPLLPIYVSETYAITPGQQMSFITATGGSITSADGRVTITEMA